MGTGSRGQTGRTYRRAASAARAGAPEERCPDRSRDPGTRRRIALRAGVRPLVAGGDGGGDSTHFSGLQPVRLVRSWRSRHSPLEALCLFGLPSSARSEPRLARRAPLQLPPRPRPSPQPEPRAPPGPAPPLVPPRHAHPPAQAPPLPHPRPRGAVSSHAPWFPSPPPRALRNPSGAGQAFCLPPDSD